ncbi:hypothetical protein PAI11_37710 [Patulibacter medicamentivorans]|uniref:Uncharacterized protein n=1 Tax=Patulibacter medicamentivorans TaxID=1097667 RepID=H0EA97_9ACTN|nr:hypothetical protein [Patulibacter medicamentivorans]EHN09437.1 hypothetical protein PAI11_37710 [Patulibacter medicamentivorans]
MVLTHTDVRVRFVVEGFDGETVTPTAYTVTATVRGNPAAVIEIESAVLSDGTVESIVYSAEAGTVAVLLRVTAPVRVEHLATYAVGTA